MAYICKYCYQKFNRKKLMVLRNCSKSPTGKHAPAGAVIKGTYLLGILIGIVIGVIELFKYLKISEKIAPIFNLLREKIFVIIENSGFFN